jgi:hypothetical protein
MRGNGDEGKLRKFNGCTENRCQLQAVGEWKRRKIASVNVL